MSFLVDKCYIFSRTLEDASKDCMELVIKDDEATVGTETSEDPVDFAQKATDIQACARGLIVRNRLNNREQLAMMQTRARAGQTINTDNQSDFDIEHNIRSVRELLKSNKEIWGRCQEGLVGENQESVRAFMRIGFETVQAATENSKVTFSSKAEQSEKSFDMHALEVLPGKLDGIFEVKYDEFGFVIYEAFLEKTLLLHEDVLGPFLDKLKNHLGGVKEILTEIDTWLIEPSIYIFFLQTIFDHGGNCKITNEPTILKECELSDDFQVKGVFKIKDSRDQKMLKKLLEFISA
jgi:hypothetical protein